MWIISGQRRWPMRKCPELWDITMDQRRMAEKVTWLWWRKKDYSTGSYYWIEIIKLPNNQFYGICIFLKSYVTIILWLFCTGNIYWTLQMFSDSES